MPGLIPQLSVVHRTARSCIPASVGTMFCSGTLGKEVVGLFDRVVAFKFKRADMVSDVMILVGWQLTLG